MAGAPFATCIAPLDHVDWDLLQSLPGVWRDRCPDLPLDAFVDVATRAVNRIRVSRRSLAHVPTSFVYGAVDRN